MLTLNQIHAQIETLANAHYQIAEVGMGTIAELQGKPDRLYPLLWLSNEGGSLEDNYKVDNIRLTMFGRVIAGEEGQDDDASEIEVLSDMQLILLDFLNYFHQQHGQEYVTDKAATLEHFTERTNDRTAGYSCVLELKQFYDWSKCQIPQSGASIPPSVDGLTLYDFCDQSVLDRLTSEQIDCLRTEFGGDCDPATLTVNSEPFGTIPSGGIENVEVRQETGATLVGSKQGQYFRIANSQAQVNGVDTETIPAEETHNQQIHDSAGSNVGTSANPSVVSDNTINFNGSDVDTVKAEEDYTFTVELNGTESGSYDAGTNTVSVTSDPVPSLTFNAYSDAGHTTPITSATYGETVYLKAVPSDITPTSYTFSFDGDAEKVVTQASGEYTWTVDVTGTIAITASATDGSEGTAILSTFTFTVPATIASVFGDDLYEDWNPEDAASLSLTGSLIDSITSTGTNAGVMAASGAVRPSLVADGTLSKDVIEFDGASEYLQVASSTGDYNFLHNGRGGHVIVVVRITGANPNSVQAFLSNSNGFSSSVGSLYAYDDRSSLGYNNRVVSNAFNGSSGNIVCLNRSSDNAFPSEQYNSVSVCVDSGNNSPVSQRSSISVNDGAAIENNSLSNPCVGSDALGNMTMGRLGSSSSYFLGAKVARVIIVKNTQSPAKIAEAQTVLESEYGTFPIS